MTQQDAQAIYNQYNNKAGRRPADYYTALTVLGITAIVKPSSKPQSKENYILKNDDVNDNEKFRYIRIKQIQQMNSTNMTPQAHHLLLALMTSPNSNSLGVYKISISEMSAQTGGQDKDTTIKALNELISLGEIRYIDGVVYLNKFLTNQKQHGNKDNLIGIIKNYNTLQDSAKLPYIGSINYQNMTMTQLVEEFHKLMKSIQMMGLVASGAGVNKEEYSSLYNEEQVKEIIVNEKHSFATTSVKMLLPVAPALLVIEEEQREEEKTLALESTQVEEEAQQIEGTTLEISPQSTKLSDDEIIKIVMTACDIKEDKVEMMSKVMKDYEFNNLFHYITKGGEDVDKINKYFKDAMMLWGENKKMKTT